MKTITLAIAFTCLALASLEAVERQSRLVAPVISSVTPRAPVPNGAAQLLTITGSNFLDGVALTVVAPDGRKLDYAGPAIRERRDTSFQVAVILAVTGAYTLIATNRDRGTSDQFVLKVQAATTTIVPTPRIDRMRQEQVTKDSQPQVLKITGDRFVEGLSVSLTDPLGVVYRFKSPAVGGVTAVSFDLSVVLEMTGEYSLMVTNPSGESSNSVNFTVVMPAR
jgi:hypothetical protein